MRLLFLIGLMLFTPGCGALVVGAIAEDVAKQEARQVTQEVLAEQEAKHQEEISKLQQEKQALEAQLEQQEQP